ncbi:ribosomal protein L1/ribosomal biogenesis protein [Phascolomyces articulosus]|uniref:Ribosomal protein L1/ribosomal biogenesis protein n=1 Tax=Phascolomyces articulosus TaxID=60185 RepID=A0AAD5PB69_9FUNG|nr:ribosomal protein L1/ribosomal biogenesis protein [Phascolomyces articulosus]
MAKKAAVKKQEKPVEQKTETPRSVLDNDLAKRAIHALYQYKESQSSNDLLESTSYLFGSITVKTLKSKSRSLKPSVISVKSSPFPSDIEVCLIVQDDKAKFEKTLKEEDLKNVKVYTLKELNDSYKRYEAKRKLAASFDVFLVDRRCATFIPKLFGKTFADRNKIPRPVALDRKTWVHNVKRALSSITFTDNNGPVKSFKFGHLGMSEEEAFENFAQALPSIISKIAGGEKNIQEVGLRMDDSVILPIYNSLPTN